MANGRLRIGFPSPNAYSLAADFRAYALNGQAATLTYGQVDAAGFDFFISPSGNNGNSGTTQGSPWALTALESPPSPINNKRIGLMDGTYILDPGHVADNNGGIQWNSTGTTLRAVNDRQAVITSNNGGSYPGPEGNPLIQVLGANSTIQGIRFSGSSFGFLRVGNTTTILDCLFEDVDGLRRGFDPVDNCGGLFIKGESYPTLVIRNCKFDNIWNGTDTANGCAIGPMYYGGNTTIEDCSFFRCHTAIGWKSDGNGPLAVRRCYFDNTVNTYAVHGGLSNDLFNGLTTCTYENNVFNTRAFALDGWDAGTAGSRGGLGDSAVISVVRRNTFLVAGSGSGLLALGYGSGDGLSGAALSGGQLNQSICKDNVLYRISGTDPFMFFRPGENSSIEMFGDIDYNMWSTVSVFDIDTTYSTMASWRSRLALGGGSIAGKEANSFVGTPTFVNGSGHTPADYALASGSGKNVSSDGTDIGAWGGGVVSIGSSF